METVFLKILPFLRVFDDPRGGEKLKHEPQKENIYRRICDVRRYMGTPYEINKTKPRHTNI